MKFKNFDPTAAGLNWFNPLTYILLFWWLGQQGRKSTYGSGWDGLITYPVGFIIACASAIASAHDVGWVSGHSWLAWLPTGFLSAYFSAWFLFPFAYVIGDKISQSLSIISRGTARKLFPKIVATLRRLPYSDRLWSSVAVDSQDDTTGWFERTFSYLTYFTGALGSAYCGWLIALAIKGWITVDFLGIDCVIGGFAGCIVFAALVTTLYQMLDHGKMEGLAVLSGVAAACVAGWLVGLHWVMPIVAAKIFSLHVAYVFPWLNKLFEERLVSFVMWLKELDKKAYSAPSTDYRLLFHHAVHATATFGIAYGAYVVATHVGLPPFISIPTAIIVAVLHYATAFSIIDHRGGNGLLSAALTALVTKTSWTLYANSVGFMGWFGSAVTSVLAGFVFFVILFPACYIAIQSVLEPLTASWGAKVDAFHKFLKSHIKKLGKYFSDWHYATYRDQTVFKRLSAQIGTIAIAGGLLALPLFIADASLITWIGSGVAAAVYYVIGGRLAKKNGIEWPVTVLSLATGSYVGASVYSALTWSTWLTVMTAGTAAMLAGWGVVLYLVPPIYTGLKSIVVDVLPGKIWKERVADVLEDLHSLAWYVFDAVIWLPLRSAYNRVSTWLYPFLETIRTWWQAMQDKLEQMFGSRT